jgi:DNA-binding CsgD family transcriptional regulator
VQLDLALLEAFSDSLMVLSRLPASVVPPRVMDEGLAALRRIVPFDAAWWGECSGGIGGLAPRNWLSGRINLGPEFAAEWNRIGASDLFALESMRQLDEVVCSSGFEDPVAEVEAFARRHDLCHAMAITRSLPGSGLLQFISLYRGEASPPFTSVQRVLFKRFSAHLMQRWSARIAELVGAEGVASSDAQALVDGRGEFVYLGARLGTLLRERFPHWTGEGLPQELTQGTRNAPRHVAIGQRRLWAQSCGDLILLSLMPARRTATLPPRELNVALLFAEGRSHKQVARETGLSPATVRTYLREAYLRLGVSDKVALGRALSSSRQRRRIP